MGRREKRLERMRANPKDDWSADDVRVLCRSYGISCDKPAGTSHFTVSDPTQEQILTVVAAKPVKPIYIKKLVAFIDAVHNARAPEGGEKDGD
jgi:hypothetical protein